PWTRYVMVRADDTMTVRCATFIHARKVEQIKANPEVHITCGCTNPAEQKPYLQIQGRAHMTTDEKERHALWTDMYSHVFEGPDDPKFGVIIMEPYRIELCTPGSHEPEVWTA
ncbi:pyridoxamine 5'-phosphate oxidase family protein, partial [Verrucomicrobiota bacterium]